MENYTIRKATSGDVARIVASMTSAFEQDPLVSWLVRKDKHKKKGIEELFKATLNVLTLPFNEVITINDGVGAILWIPRKNVKATVGQYLRLLFPIVRIAGLSGIPRVVKCLDILEKSHPMEKDHLYLFFVGVDKNNQKQGLASAMLKQSLERCDRESLGAYLENTNPANTPLYESFGFKAIGEIIVGEGAPKLIPMWREPQKVN